MEATQTKLTWTEEPAPEGCRGKVLRSGAFEISPIGKSGRFTLSIRQQDDGVRQVFKNLVRNVSVARCKEAAEQWPTEDVVVPATDTETEAAYDRACTCLPEIEAAVPAPAAERRTKAHAQPQAAPEPEKGKEPAPAPDNAPKAKPAPGKRKPARILKAGNAGEPVEAPVQTSPQAKAQAALGELVWRHGSNLQNWGTLDAVLAEAGLHHTDLSPAMWRRAEEEVTRRVKGHIDAEPQAPLVWLPPVEEHNHVSDWHVWMTECRQLRVVRSVSRHDLEGHAFRAGASKVVPFEKDRDNLIWHATDRLHKSLERAFEAAEEILKTRKNLRHLDSNRLSIIAAAKALGLDTLPGAPRPTETSVIDPSTINENLSQETAMYVEEKLARRFFAAAGVPKDTAFGWSLKKLSIKLNDPDLELEQPKDEEMQKLYARRKASLAKGREVKVGERPEEAAPAKAGKAAAKPGRNGKASKKEAAELDRFGYRVGTRKAQINALLSKTKAKTVPQLREEGEIPGSYTEYLDELEKKGIVSGNHKDGWLLKK